MAPAVMRGQPEVRLAIAWGMALAVRCDEALDIVEEIERDIGPNPSPEREVSRCECEVIRAVAIAIKDDSEAALSIAQNCLGRSADPWTANVASNVVRFGRLKSGDLKKFYATPWIPYSVDEDRRNGFAAVYYRSLQGVAEAQQLRIASANRYFRQALRLAETARRSELGRGGVARTPDRPHSIRSGPGGRGRGLADRPRAADQCRDDAGVRVGRVFSSWRELPRTG